MAKKKVLITGAAGFIGCNAAQRFLQSGWEVTLWDNLSRGGGTKNLEWLRETGGYDFHRVDLRNEKQVSNNYGQNRFDLVLHCAGQVAVTASVANPREDLECNVLGTFNLLESIRMTNPETLLVYASTNKVYGAMEQVAITERNGRYEYENLKDGISEDQPLDFHSPYGCSKGAADQYVLDYARTFGIPALVLYLFGTPGQKRFNFMWEILSEGMLGFVVMVDSTRPETFREARRILETFRAYAPTPYVVAANKQDRQDAWNVDDMRIALRLDPSVKLIDCVATNKDTVKTILLELLYTILADLDGVGH